MTYNILGMTIGSFFLIFLFLIFLWDWNKKRKFQQKIREIGRSAEEKINGDFSVWAKQTKNVFLPAALYKYSTNKVFEVDGILITSKALIVVEIKSIKGKIAGDAEMMKWTKEVNGKTFSISNPIIQNEKHIEHILKMTSIKVPTISLIVFSNRSDSIDVKNSPKHSLVIKHSELFEKLDQLNAALKPKLSDLDIKTIEQAINKFKTKKMNDKMLHKKITSGKMGKNENSSSR